MDPFAAALTLGTPMKFRPFSKLAFSIGEDLIAIRLVDYIPNVEDPLTNLNQSRNATSNTSQPWTLTQMVLSAYYQQSDAFVLWLRTGVVAADFDFRHGEMPLDVGFLYSPMPELDVGLSVGFQDQNRAKETFHAQVILGLRI